MFFNEMFLHFSFVKKASLRTEKIMRNINITCINVTILNINAVKVTVQTNLNDHKIGFTIFKQNVVSYFFLLILG